MNTNLKLDIEYIAGLFDGEGSIYYKQITEKRKGRNPCKVWKIRMEMSMTDKNVMELVHETLGCGSLRERKFLKPYAKKWKKQWRWQCSHRDALYVCKLLWPHAIVKLHKMEQIIDHYEPDIQDLGDNVVDLEKERFIRTQWP
mgnify:CR=1 FL=1|jgi:hypothetical protein|tara:strand:+ start:2739 stop:3167 length:429 start_codon:yes stop_codon:yes gene_type:complete